MSNKKLFLLLFLGIFLLASVSAVGESCSSDYDCSSGTDCRKVIDSPNFPDAPYLCLRSEGSDDCQRDSDCGLWI